MNNIPETLITADINAANLFSIAGMLRQFASDGHADILSNQVQAQARKQGLDTDTDTGYDELESKVMQFTAPVLVIADIATIMLSVRDGNDTTKGMSSAVKHLMAAWNPFVMKATEVILRAKENKDELNFSHNRFTDGLDRPESMN